MILYTEKNPSHAAEIIAFADIISNAAQNFVWDNVALYAYYFRKLMDKHPNHSWARTHTQLWSLSMREHVTHRHGSGPSGSSGSGKKTLKELTCWRYNRRKCTCGDECRFEHRCSSCGSYNHIYLDCMCRNKKQDKKSTKVKTEPATRSAEAGDNN